MSYTDRRQVGEMEVTVITDGATSFGNELFPGTSPERIGELLASAGKDEILTNFNAYLIRTSGNTILVDAGARDLFGPVAGFLPEALKEAGVETADISQLVITHLHADHVGGAIDADGNPVFPNAEVILTSDENDHWRDSGAFANADEQTTFFREVALSTLAAYEGRIRTVGSSAEIAPGITFIDLPGHTPGHVGVRIESGSEQFILVTDLFHAQDLQLADPSIGIVFDLDPEQSRETRIRTLDMLATDRLKFSGGHVLKTAVGYIERQGNGYRFVSDR